MTDAPDTLLYSESETAAAGQLADHYASREPIKVSTGRVEGVEDLLLFVRRNDQTVDAVDLTDYLPVPLRKGGAVTLADHESFAIYVNDHKDDRDTSLWGNIDSASVVAVLDDHRRNGAVDDTLAGWAGHRATLKLRHTQEWKAWTAASGNLLTQEAFTAFLEEHAQDITDPDPATFYEIAQTFSAKKGVNFKSGRVEQSGEVDLVYEETIAAKAGQKGTIPIPQSFTISIPVYDGGERHSLIARFKYRIVDGVLGLGFTLIRFADIERQAFTDITKAIAESVALPVLAGAPRA